MAIRPERAAHWSTKVWPGAALVVTVFALASVSNGLGNPDRLVASSFESALKSGQVATDRASSPASGTSLVQLSGSEEFWLNDRASAPAAVPVILKDSLNLGDRVTFGSGAQERHYQVVDIRAVGALAADGAAPTAAALLLITCRDVATPDAPPMRFVIERTDAASGANRRPPHAL